MVARWISWGRFADSVGDARAVSGIERARTPAAVIRPAASHHAAPKTAPVDGLLADERADRDAQIKGEGVVAERLSHATGGCDVGEQREARDEEGGLGRAGEEPDGDDGLDRRSQQEAEGRGSTDERTGDEQGAAAQAVGESARPRSQDESREGEGAEGEARAALVGADRADREQRNRIDHDADRKEPCQIHCREADEGWGPERLRVGGSATRWRCHGSTVRAARQGREWIRSEA